MLSLFPTLFDYSPIAITLLRVSMAYMFLLFGAQLFKALVTTHAPTGTRTLGVVYGLAQIMVGGLLAVGMYTQVAALGGVALLLLHLLTGAQTTNARHVYYLLLVIGLSLLFLGPGALAFDLPL